MNENRSITATHGGVVVSGLLGGLLIALIASLVQGITGSFTAIVAIDEHGMDARTIVVWMLVARVLFVVVPPLAGLLADRVEWPALLAGGLLLTAVAAVGIGTARSAVLAGLSVVGMGLGRALLIPSLLVTLFRSVWSHRWYATVAGLYLGTVTLGQLSSNVVVGLAHNAWSDGQYSGVFTLAGLIALVGGAVGLGGVGLSFLLGRAHPRPESQLAAPRRFWTWTLVLVGLVVLFAGWATTAYGSPPMPDAGQWSESEIALWSIFTVWSMLAAMQARFVSGPLADLVGWLLSRSANRSWGRTLILLLGALVICCGTILYLASQEMTVAGVARIVIGVGYGMLRPSLIALVCVNVRPSRLGLALGLYLATGTLGELLSVPVNTLLVQKQIGQGAFTSAAVAAGLSLAAAFVLLGLQLAGNRDKLEPVAVEQ